MPISSKAYLPSRERWLSSKSFFVSWRYWQRFASMTFPPIFQGRAGFTWFRCDMLPWRYDIASKDEDLPIYLFSIMLPSHLNIFLYLVDRPEDSILLEEPYLVRERFGMTLCISGSPWEHSHYLQNRTSKPCTYTTPSIYTERYRALWICRTQPQNECMA